MDIRKLPLTSEQDGIDVAVAINALIDGFTNLSHYQVHHKEPDKSEGTVAVADGTNWNPAAGGKGIYYYDGTTWNKL